MREFLGQFLTWFRSFLGQFWHHSATSRSLTIGKDGLFVLLNVWIKMHSWFPKASKRSFCEVRIIHVLVVYGTVAGLICQLSLRKTESRSFHSQRCTFTRRRRAWRRRGRAASKIVPFLLLLSVTDFRGKIFCSPDMGNCGNMNSNLATCCLSEAHHFFVEFLEWMERSRQGNFPEENVADFLVHFQAC